MLGDLLKLTLATILPGASLVRLPRDDKAGVALTFDDGPHDRLTPRILDILEAGEVPATFFLVGSVAEQRPALVREIHARGHQVANHGYRHLNARKVSVKEYLADAIRAQALLQDIVGQRLEPDFRPPYGAVTPAAYLALYRNGFRQVYWSVDSLDHSMTDPAAIVERTDRMTGPGDMVLMHDDYEHTPVALEGLLDRFRQRGLCLRLVSPSR